ncbi:hypothetical protein ACQ4PT_003167 [Festuca glaucescens]
MDYCPDSWDEPTFTGLAAGCPEVCRLHGKEPVKRVAFEGMNTGRRFYMCSVQAYIENCGFHSWLDDEWPQPMNNTLLKLWEMYHDMHNALLDEKIENGKLVKDLNEEKIKVEKKYSNLMADVSKFMNDTERQVMQANYDKIMNGSEEEKLREIKTKLENELMKANVSIPGSEAVVVLGAENLAAAEALGTAGALAGVEALGAASAALALGGAGAGGAVAGAGAALALAGAGGALAGAGAGGAVAGAGAALAGAGGGAAAVLADAEVLPSSVCLVLYKHANKVIILEKQVLYLA